MKNKVIFTSLCLTMAIFMIAIFFASPTALKAQDGSTPEPSNLVEDFLGFEMVYVPAGTVEMGIGIEAVRELNQALGLDPETNLENLQPYGVLDTYVATLRGFWIDRYEVTIAQYQEHHERCMSMGTCLDIRSLGRSELESDIQQPQVGVPWYDAMRFCNMRGARLPSEEEWEYAASGPENFLFPWGNSPTVENVRANAILDGTYPVGSLPENVSWVGAYDMAGNAAEWVEDRFDRYPSSEEDWTSSFPSTEYYRVVRGGYYADNLSKMATYERVAINPGSSEIQVGFRCARFSDPSLYR